MFQADNRTKTVNNTFADASDCFLKKISDLPREHFYLLVFHLSKNNLSYLRAAVKNLPYTAVISIPYSEQAEVKREIEKYTSVYSLPLEDIPAGITRICNEHKNKQVVLIEIGGYSAAVASTISNVILAVEDTERGHREFLLHERYLPYPVVSIARTEGKKMENATVGRAIAEATQLTVRSLPKVLSAAHVLVLGYGGVGRAVAHSLKAKGCLVSTYDPEPERLAIARKDGCFTPSRTSAITNADIIIGCSGYESIHIDDISRLASGTLLISGSSRQIELPYKSLLAHKDQAFENELIEKCNVGKKSIYIAYKGQPINFCYDVSLGDIFDIPMTLLIHSVIWGLKNNLPNKVHDLSQEECTQVLLDLANH